MKRWPVSWATPPAIVAESLATVRNPLAAALRAGPAVSPERVAAALTRALLPPLAPDPPPAWLRGDQRLSFGRALAAVRRYRGALLADPVGTGKTWIGLAVAHALEPGRPITVIAPAIVLDQWREVASRAGVKAQLWSHERLSRGRVPEELRGGGGGAVLVDESHRLRTPATRRYRTLAPWLVGRRGLLLTATPVVNRLADLAHQLLLLVRDDSLAPAGLGSLRESLGTGTAPPALAELVVTGEDRSAARPLRSQRTLAAIEDPRLDPVLERLDALALSRNPAVATLVRGAFWHALASSPAALAASLSRYRALLLHAHDASEAGRRPSRRALLDLIRGQEEQLILWELLDSDNETAELVPADFPALDALLHDAAAWAADGDMKAAVLDTLLEEPLRTLVFCTATETIAHLRRRLGARRVAWCTGSGSGAGTVELPRRVVLDWFRRPDRPAPAGGPPLVLLAGDVAAEGLDLPLVERVVHYDLPWTAVRLAQRDGRALRLGARHPSVEVVRFEPAAALDHRLRRVRILTQKATLPALLGLELDAGAPWRWRARLAERWTGVEPSCGVAAVRAGRSGVVAGVRLGARALVVAEMGDGWTEDPRVIGPLLDAASGAPIAARPARVRAVLRRLAPLLREALRRIRSARWGSSRPNAETRRAVAAVVRDARLAARRRDAGGLERAEAALRFLRRGRTAGEDLLLARLLDGPPRECLSRLPGETAERAPPERVSGGAEEIAVIGILLSE